ncbi:recombinase family protein [Halovibrio sp. HP20-50]|uniref:recombinase family protein n=1 Tax=Halovibrio sp. HP20-59 TaxID=3080275 RepID=UPI00294B8DD6|nr:recombinase family protein [Halovibrio sp. HP20-59]MEA2119749.1 recombinase family protein [Halovibrio sp. HP20-59]
MFIRAYLRASTKEQDAERARAELEEFASEHNQTIAAWYAENESGATLRRPELMKLIRDSQPGDVILVEQIDRLARLEPRDWDTLKAKLAEKQLSVVSKEIPTSYMALQQKANPEFTDSILRAVNAMLLDMLAAVARKDYDDRRRRQRVGIDRAKEKGKYRGRKPDMEKRARIAKMIEGGLSYSDIQKTLQCSRKLIVSVVRGETVIGGRQGASSDA